MKTLKYILMLLVILTLSNCQKKKIESVCKNDYQYFTGKWTNSKPVQFNNPSSPYIGDTINIEFTNIICSSKNSNLYKVINMSNYYAIGSKPKRDYILLTNEDLNQGFGTSEKVEFTLIRNTINILYPDYVGGTTPPYNRTVQYRRIY